MVRLLLLGGHDPRLCAVRYGNDTGRDPDLSPGCAGHGVVADDPDHLPHLDAGGFFPIVTRNARV